MDNDRENKNNIYTPSCDFKKAEEPAWVLRAPRIEENTPKICPDEFYRMIKILREKEADSLRQETKVKCSSF